LLGLLDGFWLGLLDDLLDGLSEGFDWAFAGCLNPCLVNGFWWGLGEACLGYAGWLLFEFALLFEFTRWFLTAVIDWLQARLLDGFWLLAMPGL
jgi:hypothetical protein